MQYSSGNKADKFLANRFKAKKLQSKIEFLLDSMSKNKNINPKKIADAFASY